MGKYLDALQNFSPDPPEFNLSIEDDLVGQAARTANEETSGYVGLGILSILWFTIFLRMSRNEAQFNLTQSQVLLSTNVIIFTIAILLVYIGILASIQHFVWTSLLVLVSNISMILRTS